MMKTWSHITMMLVAVLLTMLAACTADDDHDAVGAGDDGVGLQLSVGQEPWAQVQQHVALTRGATLDAMTAVGYAGIGLWIASDKYMTEETMKYKWDEAMMFKYTGGKWLYGGSADYVPLWPQRVPSIDVYAYAPYSAALTGSTYDFSCPIDNPTDLLWACNKEVSRTTHTANLTFKHALARLSVGTLTNNSSESITLTKIAVGGTFYPQATLNLADGTWSDYNTAAPVTALEYDYSGDIVNEADKNIKNISKDKNNNEVVIMQIPGPAAEAKVTLTFYLSGHSDKEHTATVTVPLTSDTKGKDTQLNLEIKNNFRVVIKTD